MKAVVIREYGASQLLHIEEVDKPRIKPDEVLLKVHASSINPIDWKIRQGMLKIITGNKFPMILGMDVSGEVVEIGEQVTQLQIGDRIVACLQPPGGAYSEFVSVPTKLAAQIPPNLTYEQAATVPLAAMTALQALRDKGKIQAGQTVLINGASGGVGCFAVQIAKNFDAKVTGVCSGRNIEFVKSLGAEKVIDYTQENFTQIPTQYDIVFDAVAKSSFAQSKKILKGNGVYITTLPTAPIIIQGFLTSFLPGQTAKLIFLSSNHQDLQILMDWMESGKLQTFIDKTFSLAEIAAAHAYSETARTVGKIAITVT